MRTIRLSEHGVMPNTDITLPLYRLFLKYPFDTEFVFENADYYFSPCQEMRADYRLSNSDRMPYRTLGVWMKKMKNCSLTGNGARLWFAGQMQSFTLDHCENVKLSGFVINWKKPLVIEGTVVSRDEEHLNVYIDPEKFPHRLSNGVLEYDVGAGEWCKVNSNIIAFEPYSRTVRRGTGDFDLLEISELGNCVYSLKIKQKKDVRVGDILNLRSAERLHTNIFSEKCRDITVEDVTVHSSGGLGCLAQFCHNVTYRRVRFVPDATSGRLVSCGHDDGMQITCNSGTVTVTECTFHALNDDPINVHGCCVTCDEVVDERTLRCRYRHRQACGFHYWAEEGDTVSFIDRGSMNSMETAKVKKYVLENYETFLLTLDSPLPQEILQKARCGNALAIDNITHTVDFVCTKNRFGSCRARGVLVSTAGNVRISDNYFESSGSAILLSGDSNYWFESGECHNVEITGNVFTDGCLSSYYQFCDGVISISPVVPMPQLDKPYHKNISITENVFDCPETPVLCSFSCEGLRFMKNRIFKSPFAELSTPVKEYINLSYCKNVTVLDNEWVGCFASAKRLKAENCDGIVSDEG